jgi:hypothetical protein
VTIHIWTAKRANTGYILYVIYDGAKKTADAAEISELIELID